MTSDVRPKALRGSFGLTAIGCSDAWDLTIDESLNEEEGWEAELEGPNLYASFSLQNLDVIKNALEYLQTRILVEHGASHEKTARREGLTLGKFGESKVELIWDDEDFERCFLVVGPAGGSVIRLSLFGRDIEMLTLAFRKVVEQLPANPEGA